MKLILLSIFILQTICLGQWALKIDGLKEWSSANPLSFGSDGSIAIWVNTSEFPRPISLLTNYTESWINYNTPESFGGTHISIRNENQIWFSTGDGKIYHSQDGGANWQLQYTDTLNQEFIEYINFFDDLNGVAVSDAFTSPDQPAPILRTTNGGLNWFNVNQNYLLGEYSRDQFHPISFPTSTAGYYFGSKAHKLYKTLDGGTSWSIVTLPSEVKNVYMLDFYNENIGMLVQDNGLNTDYLYRTIDGGISWKKLDLESNTVHHDIEFIPGYPARVWFTDHDRLFFSADTGTTWQQVEIESDDLRARNIEFFNDNIGALLCDHNQFFLTTNNGGIIVSSENDEKIVNEFSLSQNYPNPFNPTTTIKFTIPISPFHPSPYQGEGPRERLTKLIVYNILGQQVKTLVNEVKSPGNYEVTFDASQLASGVYFYRLKSGSFVQTNKMILLR